MAEERVAMSLRGSGGPDGAELKFTSSAPPKADSGLVQLAPWGRNHPASAHRLTAVWGLPVWRSTSIPGAA